MNEIIRYWIPIFGYTEFVNQFMPEQERIAACTRPENCQQQYMVFEDESEIV